MQYIFKSSNLFIFKSVMWAVKDSNLRSRKTAELQSAPVGHFGNCPFFTFLIPKTKIAEPLVGFEPTTPRLQITCSGQLS